jgi:hypothetical protein
MDALRQCHQVESSIAPLPACLRCLHPPLPAPSQALVRIPGRSSSPGSKVDLLDHDLLEKPGEYAELYNLGCSQKRNAAASGLVRRGLRCALGAAGSHPPVLGRSGSTDALRGPRVESAKPKSPTRQPDLSDASHNDRRRDPTCKPVNKAPLRRRFEARCACQGKHGAFSLCVLRGLCGGSFSLPRVEPRLVLHS